MGLFPWVSHLSTGNRTFPTQLSPTDLWARSSHPVTSWRGKSRLRLLRRKRASGNAQAPQGGARGKPDPKCCFDKNELRHPLIVAAIRSDYRPRHRVPIHRPPRFAMSGVRQPSDQNDSGRYRIRCCRSGNAPLTNWLVVLAQPLACARWSSFLHLMGAGAVGPIGIKAKSQIFLGEKHECITKGCRRYRRVARHRR